MLSKNYRHFLISYIFIIISKKYSNLLNTIIHFTLFYRRCCFVKHPNVYKFIPPIRIIYENEFDLLSCSRFSISFDLLCNIIISLEFDIDKINILK